MRIKQQARRDCAVCAIAMFLGIEHKTLMTLLPFLTTKVNEDEHRGIVERGGLAKTEMLMVITSASGRAPMLIQNIWDAGSSRKEELFELIKGRKAILLAKSLNVPNVAHAVYWDGKKIIDPSNDKTYTKATIDPFEVIL